MKRLVLLLLAVALLALPAAAMASGSSTCQAYDPQTCNVVGSQTTQRNTVAAQTTARTVSSSNAATLPFTGLDVALLASGGLVLLAAGVIVRRVSGPHNN